MNDPYRTAADPGSSSENYPYKEWFHVHIAYSKTKEQGGPGNRIEKGWYWAEDRYGALQQHKKKYDVNQNMIWYEDVRSRKEFDKPPPEKVVEGKGE